jgi:hypothetical protein
VSVIRERCNVRKFSWTRSDYTVIDMVKKRREEEGELVKESFRIVDSSKGNSQQGRSSNDNNLSG